MITIYTDGACKGNPGPMGIGILIIHPNRSNDCTTVSESIGTGTNNIAELTAIGEALDYLEPEEFDMPVRLHTDSSYAIGVLTGDFRINTNHALIAQIKLLMAKFTDLQLVKVKGHSGHLENSLVDKLASTAAAARKSVYRLCSLKEAFLPPII